MGNFLIKDIVRTVLHVPFHERCADAMEVYGPGWAIVELIEVETEGGVTGVGETIQGYTWGHSQEAQFAAARGKNVFDLLWDDSLGAGLQMALFDAAGKHLDVPCHRLMGPQHREACPVSWWAQSMAPEAWAVEARAAEAHGFNTMKVKARPWYDIAAQLKAVDQATPEYFKLDADFNTMLLGVDQAAPLISKLERDNDCLAIVESPIPQDDVEGNKLLRRKIQSPIAMHMGQPPAMTAIREGVCDGFVIGGGVQQVLSDGNLAARAQMPFWLQMVGTGLTTTFAAHIGSVLKEARWPAIPCVNIYSHTLLREFEVKGGHLQVPQTPGLGVELDREAVECFRVEPDFAKPTVRQIHEVHWPDGRVLCAADGGYRGDFVAGKITGFLPGMDLQVRLDDGSEEFAREYVERFPGRD